LDETNYQNYISGQEFEGYHSLNDSDSVAVAFEFDGLSDLYCVFDNSNSLHTLQHLMGSVKLFSVYDPEIPQVQMLPNYPNPMNPQNSGTTITFKLPHKSNVELTIYNVLGQKVKTLVNAVRYAGEFDASWDGRNRQGQMVSSGVYFCEIKTKNNGC